MTDSIDLTPEVLKTPEGARKVQRAMSEYENATVYVAQLAEEYVKLSTDGTSRKGRIRLAFNALQNAIVERKAKQEAFARSLMANQIKP